MVARQFLTSGYVGSACSRGFCVQLYESAKAFIVKAGYGHEIGRQMDSAPMGFSESDLLREAAWVILCSGFRESIIRKIFDYISLCFCDWNSAAEIVRNESNCVATAYRAFKNARKLGAVIDVAKRLAEEGVDDMNKRARSSPIECFVELPYIGPVTAYHLAKNLGFDVAKNDRHLRRLSAALGFSDAQDLCEAIAVRTGESVAVVDSVLWRFMTLQGWKGGLECVEKVGSQPGSRTQQLSVRPLHPD